MQDPEAPQTTPATRLVGLDLARFLAIVGMVIVNYRVTMAYDQDAPESLSFWMGLCEGRASALFVTLAGCGLSLMAGLRAGHQEPERLGRARKILFKRALFLLAIGYAWSPLWAGDILHYYGVYLLLGLVLLAVPSLVLWIAAIAFMAGFVVLGHFFDYGAGWRWADLSYPAFWTPEGQLRNLLYNGWHPVVPWMAFLLVGMWLGRQDFSDPRRRWQIFNGAAAMALAAETASRFLSARPDQFPASTWLGASLERWWFLPDTLYGTESIPPMPLYVLSAGGTAIAIIMLCVMVSQARAAAWVLRPFISTGQLALTIYLAHVLLAFAIFGDPEQLDPVSLETVMERVLYFCGGAVIFSTLWKLVLRQGPLEWVMRRICG